MSENMKPSGIAWIGSIPESWELHKIKYCSYLKGRIGWQGLKADEFIDEGPYLITGTDFENGRIQFDRSYHISEERYNEAPEIQLKEGDLLVTKDGTVGKMAYVSFLPDKASLNSHLLLIRPLINVYINKFMFWLMSSRVFTDYTDFAQDGTVMASLSQEKIGNLIAYFPSLPEQTLIANFLDEQCEKIDSISNNLEKQIEILQKYKKSLITETVTKGLNKSVQMKDSGIEWIGDIPEHWEVKRIKYCCTIIGSGTTPESSNFEYYDGDYAWIQSGDLYGRDVIVSTEKTITQLAANTYSTLKMYLADYVVVAMYGASVGNVAISKIDAYVNQACCVLAQDSRSDVRYLFYWLVHCKEDLIQQSFGGGQPNISQQKIRNEPMLSLPLDDQIQIAKYLDEQCLKVDSIIESKKEQLTKITQYKKSLIYEYVTGKKRVKGTNSNGN
jgi:type I restriction enzyme S subunit